MLIAINYHYIRPAFNARFDGIHGVTPSQFGEQLKLLSRAGEFVSAAQVRDAIRGRSVLPERALLVTFDDGLREQYEYALPVLNSMGIPAIFFVNTSPIASQSVTTVHMIHLLRSSLGPREFTQLLESQGKHLGIELDLGVPDIAAMEHYGYDTPDNARLKYLLNFMLPPNQQGLLIGACFDAAFGPRKAQISKSLYLTTEQIRVLSNCHSVGSHTHDHLPIGLLPPRKIKEQIEKPQVFLEKWTGYRPFALSYPYGSREACSPVSAEVAGNLGIEFAFTMERAGNIRLSEPLHLARLDCNDAPGGKEARWSIDEFFAGVPAASWGRVEV